MKNFSKSIAAISMSLLTVAAFGQTPVHNSLNGVVMQHTMSHANAKELAVLHAGNKTHSPMTMSHLELQYFNTDFNNVGQGNFTYWIPPAYCNMAYSAADTGAGTNKNYNGYHSAIVIFDTLVDVYDIPYSASSGSVTVDTVFADLGYRNTSNSNDTLVFHIGSVGTNGYPTGTFYTNDTVIVAPHSAALPGTYLDSIYEIYIIPNGGAGFTIPTGSKFNVTIEEYGSKLDTLGPFYGSPYFSCNGNGWASRTTVGYPMGVIPRLNSLMTGFQFYNTVNFGGNGSVLTWPNPNGDLYNSASSFGECWNTNTGCGVGLDSSYLYYQDLFISVGIDYNDVTGVSAINPSGLSVGQNYPNPFNKQTTISYSLTKASNVTFTIYDMTGRIINTTNYGSVAPGQYQINLSANTFSPGVYFYTFNVNGSTVTKKMVITE